MRRFDQNVNAPGVQFKKAIRKTPDRMGNLLSWLAVLIPVVVLVLVPVVWVLETLFARGE